MFKACSFVLVSEKNAAAAAATATTTTTNELVLRQEDEYAFLSQSFVLYCEFVEHPPIPPVSTPVRQQRRRWRSFALFLTCRFQTFLLSIQFVSNA